MPYEKGHKYHAPKARAMKTKHLASEIRDKIPPEIFVNWHAAIANGYNPELYVDPETDELQIRVDQRAGIGPTLQEKTASMQWLAEMSYGKAPQIAIIENILRVESAGQQVSIAGKLKPASVRALRDAIRLSLAPGAGQPAPRDAQGDGEPAAIDAEFTELNVKEQAPAGSADEFPASSDSSPAAG